MATQPITLKSPVRVAFPALFVPTKTETGDKYSLTLLIPKTEEGSKIKAILAELLAKAVAEQWPDVKTRPAKLLNPIHDGDSGDDTEDGIAKGTKYAGFSGHWYCNVSSKFRPGILDRKKAPVIDPEQVYGGQWMFVQLSAYCYDNKKKGASFGLHNVMIARDDERFGGTGPKAEDAFADVKTDDAMFQ